MEEGSERGRQTEGERLRQRERARQRDGDKISAG